MRVVTSRKTFYRSEFWFNDGNIIIIASQVAFKLHRGQLERHSEFFRDMFSLPQPPVQELIDGCPWFELHDPPADVLSLMRALYDGLYFQKSSARNFPVLAAVLRLATKYLIDHLRQRCLLHLGMDWPATLEGWDLREKQSFDSAGRYSPRDACAHPLLLINLARDLGLYHLLPAAYYDLSRYGPRRIVSGTPGLALALQVRGSPPPPPPETIYLENEDLRTILLGREAGQRFLSSFIEAELNNRAISENCTNKHHEQGRACRDSLYYVMLNVLRAVGGITHGRDADPLFTLTQMVEMLSRTDFTDGVKRCGLKICGSCKADLSDCVTRAREHVWNLIPSWFGLSDCTLTPEVLVSP